MEPMGTVSAYHSIDPESGYLQTTGDFDAPFDASKKKLFVEAYRSHGLDLSATCKDMGLSKHTFYKHLRIDPVFKEQVNEMLEEYADKLEWVSRENAMNPTKGFMDRCMQLRHLRPGKYAPEKQSGQNSEVVIKINGNVVIDAKRRAEIVDTEIVKEGETARMELGTSPV